MFKLASFALIALAAVAAVNGAVVFPRKNPPPGWVSGQMEPHDAYHTRYIAAGCQAKHNTQFFDDCCHPMKKGETLEKDRKPYCCPGSPSSTPAVVDFSSPAPSPTSVPDDGDNNNDDDDNNEDGDCDEDPSSPAPVPTPSKTPESTPDFSPSSDPSPSPSPSPSSTPSPAEPSSVEPSPTPSETPVNNPSSGSEVHTGGQATWFDQGGIAGACGTVNSDDAFIVALDPTVWGDINTRSGHCDQQISISWNGKTIQVTAADECMGCGPNSLDLSHAAFEAFASRDVGVLQGITWEFI